MKSRADDWNACPEGEISRLTTVLQQSHHQYFTGIVIGVVASIVFVATIIGLVSSVF